MDAHNIDVVHATYDDLQAFVFETFQQISNAKTQARLLSSIHAFYRFLLYHRYIEQDPSELLEMPRIEKHLPEVLSVEEIDAMIAQIDMSKREGHRNRAIIEMLYGSGLRVSELTELRLSNIYRQEGYMRIIGKGNKQRLVPIGSTARERIMLYIDDRREAVKAKPKCGDTLFLNNRGSALTRVMVFLVIRQAVANAGIDKRVSPHTFRHSFASHLLAGGAGIRQVQEMLGHESIVTTEIYTHLDKSHLRDTVEKLTL
jgi:integrase/recombinase XerD